MLPEFVFAISLIKVFCNMLPVVAFFQSVRTRKYTLNKVHARNVYVNRKPTLESDFLQLGAIT